MDKLIFLALFALTAGLQTSVSIPAGFHIFGAVPAVYYSIKNKELWGRLPKSFWALTSFIFLFIMSSAINFSEMHEATKSIGNLKYYLMALLFIFPLHHYFQKDRTSIIRFLVNFFFISTILALVIGIIRSELQFDPFKMEPRAFNGRLGGFYGYMRYAYNIQFFIVIFTSLIIFRKKFKPYFNSKLLYLAYISSWLGLILSETRGALLATIGGIIIICFLYNKKIGLKLLSLTVILGIIGLIVVFTGGSSHIRVLEKYNSTSNTIRLSQFQSAIYAFKEKPILGWGPKQLRYNIKVIKEKYDLPHKEYTNQHAHNLFLEILANLGILGVITFSTWLILWGIELFRSEEEFPKFFIFPCVIVILISSQVEYLLNSTGSFTILFLYSLWGHFSLRAAK